MPSEGIFELAMEKAATQRIPIHCHFDLTYRCNLNCQHCYVVRESRPELETFKIKSILNQLAEIGTLYLCFSGGEVLIREDFFEIAEYARELQFALRIITNGTIIGKEAADRLAALNLDMISLSIYSSQPTVHDKITGVPGSLEKTIRAAEMLKKRGVRLRINNILMKQNWDHYPHVHKIAQSLGAEFIIDPRIMTKINRDPSPIQFQIDPEKLAHVLADPLLKIKYDDNIADRYPKAFTDDFLCGASHNYCYISPYGDVFPCVQFPVRCGNLCESSFSQIWYHSPQMLEISSMRISKLPICSECELIHYCRYCPGLSYLEEDNILKPSQRNCQEAMILSQIGGDIVG